jgi:hypothetical protein
VRAPNSEVRADITITIAGVIITIKGETPRISTVIRVPADMQSTPTTAYPRSTAQHNAAERNPL